MLVRLSHRDRCAVVTALKMGVRSTAAEALESDFSGIARDEESIEDLVDKMPDASSAVIGGLLTEHFDEVAGHYPILFELENLLALSGLAAQVKEDCPDSALAWWLKDYPVAKIKTPTEVENISRGVVGLAYEIRVSGGIIGKYEQVDVWTDGVISRHPRYLKASTLRSRPGPDAVAWRIPLGVGGPDEWPPEAQTIVGELPGSNLGRYETARACESATARWFLESSRDRATRDLGMRGYPKLTPDWYPSTAGRNMIEFRAGLGMSYQSVSQYYRISGGLLSTYGLSRSLLSISVPVSLRWVYNNVHEMGVRVPFTVINQFDDSVPEVNLPGFKDNTWGYSYGIENPTFFHRLQIFSGLNSGEHLVYPRIVVSQEFSPSNYTVGGKGIVAGDQTKEEFQFIFGNDQKVYTKSVEFLQPLGNSGILQGNMEFFSDPRDALSFDVARTMTLAAIVRIDTDSGTSMGAHIRRSSRPAEDYQETTYLASLSVPGIGGWNAFYVGWSQPHAANDAGSNVRLTGNLVVYLSLDGVSLFRQRIWF